jgi:hypothetical protein
MTTIGEHRGVLYKIPSSDDGSWCWFAWPAKTPSKTSLRKFMRLNALPRPLYRSHALAIEGAKAAIEKIVPAPRPPRRQDGSAGVGSPSLQPPPSAL